MPALLDCCSALGKIQNTDSCSRQRRRHLDALLRDTPELGVLIDTFEQRVQRPHEPQERDGFYSGKKKQHTLKSQVAVDEDTGEVVDTSRACPDPRPI